MKRIWTWRADDALECLLDRLTRDAEADHYRATVLWALVTPHQREHDRKKSPELPRILQNRR